MFSAVRPFYSADNKIPYQPLGVVALVFSGMTIVRNPVRKNNLTLFLTDSLKALDSLRLQDHLGAETYKYFVKYQAALSPTQIGSLFSIVTTQAEKALAIDQPPPTAYLNAGNVRYCTKKYPAAAEQYKKALSRCYQVLPLLTKIYRLPIANGLASKDSKTTILLRGN